MGSVGLPQFLPGRLSLTNC